MSEPASPPAAGPGPVGSDGPKRWPLSYPQSMLWFLADRWPDADMQHRLTVAFVERLTGGETEAEVASALDTLLATHEPLRMAIVDGPDGPEQVVLEKATAPLEVTRLSGLDAAGEAAARDRLVAEFVTGPLSAYAAPACRFLLILGAHGPPQLAGLVHHLFFDYWSASILSDQFHQLLRGEPPPDPERPQYVDFVVWERELLASEDSRADIDYWADRLDQMVPLRLPVDRERPWQPRGTAHRASLVIDAELAEPVRALAARRRMTPAMVYSGCLAAVLAARSGQRDIAVPTLFSGRIDDQLGEMIGYFDNIMILRLGVDRDQSVGAYLERVAESVMADQQRHKVPLLKILQRVPRVVTMISDPRNIWPLFHYQLDESSLHSGRHPIQAGRSSLPGRDEDDDDDEETYSFGADLDITLRDTAAGVYVLLFYNFELFDEATARDLLRSFRAVLDRLVGPGALDRRMGWLVGEVGDD